MFGDFYLKLIFFKYPLLLFKHKRIRSKAFSMTFSKIFGVILRIPQIMFLPIMRYVNIYFLFQIFHRGRILEGLIRGLRWPKSVPETCNKSIWKNGVEHCHCRCCCACWSRSILLKPRILHVRILQVWHSTFLDTFPEIASRNRHSSSAIIFEKVRTNNS